MAEADHQRWLAEYLDALGLVWCHVPNERPLMGHLRRALIAALGREQGRKVAAAIGKTVGGILRGQGVKPGVQDVLIFTPPPGRPDVAGVAIELKEPGGTATRDQLDWLDWLDQCNWITEICYGWVEAAELVRELGYERGAVNP